MFFVRTIERFDTRVVAVNVRFLLDVVGIRAMRQIVQQSGQADQCRFGRGYQRWFWFVWARLSSKSPKSWSIDVERLDQLPRYRTNTNAVNSAGVIRRVVHQIDETQLGDPEQPLEFRRIDRVAFNTI